MLLYFLHLKEHNFKIISNVVKILLYLRFLKQINVQLIFQKTILSSLSSKHVKYDENNDAIATSTPQGAHGVRSNHSQADNFHGNLLNVGNQRVVAYIKSCFSSNFKKNINLNLMYSQVLINLLNTFSLDIRLIVISN